METEYNYLGYLFEYDESCETVFIIKGNYSASLTCAEWEGVLTDCTGNEDLEEISLPRKVLDRAIRWATEEHNYH